MHAYLYFWFYLYCIISWDGSSGSSSSLLIFKVSPSKLKSLVFWLLQSLIFLPFYRWINFICLILSSSLNYRQLKDEMVAEIGCLTNPFPSFWLYCQIVFSACLVVMCWLRSSQRDLGRSDENYFQVWLIKTLYIGLPCSFHVCYLNAEDCRILGEGNMEEV